MRDDKTDMQSAEKTDRLKLCTKPAIGSENTQSAPGLARAGAQPHSLGAD